MELKQLEQELDDSLYVHHREVVGIVEKFHIMDKEDREYMLSEILEGINRQTFYTFLEYKNNLLKYLKELER